MNSRVKNTIPAKTIITKMKRPSDWFGADYNMNIYRGCSHGCIYCDSRSVCYRIHDFSTIKIKENALQIIRDELRRKVKTGVVHTGSMSDPYNPLEREHKLTRNSLELLNAYGFGAAVTTKSPLITRDIDVLTDIKSQAPVIVNITVTAFDDGLCGKIEPNVPAASERMKAVSALSAAGIFCGIMLNPVLPYVTDDAENILNILKTAKESGAQFVHTFMSMSLREGSRDYYYGSLQSLFPGITDKYVKKYGNRYICYPPHVKKLWDVFANECEHLGLIYDMNAIAGRYKAGYGSRQMGLQTVLDT